MGRTFFIFNQNNKFGFRNEQNNILIEPMYKEVKDFIGEYCWVKNDKWNLIDIHNKNLFEGYDEVLYFDNMFSFVKKNNLTEFIDHQKLVSKEIKNEFVGFGNDIILTKNIETNKYIFLNLKLENLFSTQFDLADIFQDFFAPVCIKNKWGVINNSGKIIIDYEYDKIYKYATYLFKVEKDNKIFFIDIRNNKYLLENKHKYKFNDCFTDEGIIVYKDNKFGLMTEFFELLFLKKLDWLNDFKFNIAIYKKNGKYGFININGITIVKPIFDQIFDYDTQYAFVLKNNSYNYYCFKTKKLLF